AQPLPSNIRCDQSFGLEEFTIYSPNHPLPYPTEVHCRYVVIRSSSDICGLEVTFVSFDIEDYYQCQKDYLDIDGERLCGALPSNSVRAGKWTVMGKDNWTPYRAYLRSDLRTSPPLKRSQPPETDFRRC
ncbi:hypothetical protein AVEN_56954-1, partial [Araneus ventricosus]